MLRTLGDKGFIAPRVESPHGKRHRKGQDPSRPVEPHGQKARTGRPPVRTRKSRGNKKDTSDKESRRGLQTAGTKGGIQEDGTGASQASKSKSNITTVRHGQKAGSRKLARRQDHVGSAETHTLDQKAWH